MAAWSPEFHLEWVQLHGGCRSGLRTTRAVRVLAGGAMVAATASFAAPSGVIPAASWVLLQEAVVN